MRKVKRENWTTLGYRNVLRDKKGCFVTWGKWSPKYRTVKIFTGQYKALLEKKLPPIREKNIYNFAVYVAEDTEEGTGVKDEFYVEDFVTDLTIEELDEEYSDKLVKILKKKIGKTEKSKFGHTHFIILKQKKTFAQKSLTMNYKLNVMNISKKVNERFKYIRSKDGIYEIE